MLFVTMISGFLLTVLYTGVLAIGGLVIICVALPLIFRTAAAFAVMYLTYRYIREIIEKTRHNGYRK